MTRDAAHIPARSQSEIADPAAADTPPAATSGEIPGLAVTPPRFGAFAGTPGVDIELLGRGSQAMAAIEADRPVPVGAGVGAAEPHAGAAGMAARTPYVVSSAPGTAGTASLPGDFPRWSFGTPDVAEPGPATPDNQVELPFLAAPPAPPAAAAPMPTFGPVGRTRSALAVPFLAVITLGVYALFWTHRLNRELEEFDAKLHARPRRTVVAVAVPWLIGLLVTLAGAGIVVAGRLGVQLPVDTHLSLTQASLLLAGLGAVPYLTLLIPFSLAAVVMTLERLRCVEEHMGVTTDKQVRPIGTALLLALPVVGGLVLLGLQQRRANQVWAGVAPTGYVFN